MRDTERLNEEVLPLVLRARTGDQEALGELAGACLAHVHRWALAQTGDPDDADDVAQEVLMKLDRRIRRFDERSRFSTWLYQVTRNAARDLSRKKASHVRVAREFSLERGHVDTDRLTEISDAQLAGLVRAYFETLPPQQREVFDLVDLQGMPPAEAAECLRMNPATVRSHLFKARRTIRRRILINVPELREEFGTAASGRVNKK